MHAFPSAAELHFFIGRELETVCIGLWLINLGFGKASINVEGALERIDQSGTARLHNTDETRRSAVYLHHLLVRQSATWRLSLSASP